MHDPGHDVQGARRDVQRKHLDPGGNLPTHDATTAFRHAGAVRLLLQYGLSEAVLVELGEMLDRFDAAALLTNNGRTTHKGATRQLERLATELASVVRTMDTWNRLRFKDNAQLLASWISASTVLGTRREVSEPAETPEAVEPAAGSTQGGAPAAVGEERPAA